MSKKNDFTNPKKNGRNFFAKNRIAIGILMLVVSVLIGIIILPSAIKNSGTQVVYVTKDAIKTGTVINMEMLEKSSTADTIIGSTAFTNVDKIVKGEVMATTDLPASTYITIFNVSTGSNVEVGIPEGKQLISIPVLSLHASVSYNIEKGDVVRFYTQRAGLNKEVIVEVPSSLYALELYEIYDGSGIPVSKSGAAPASLSFPVTEQQAIDIVKYLSGGAYMSLIAEAKTEKAAKMLENQQRILDGEDINEVDESVKVDIPEPIIPIEPIIEPEAEQEEVLEDQPEEVEETDLAE